MTASALHFVLAKSKAEDAFRHDHLSGRYTATPEQEERALDDLMSEADLITTTEVDANVRARCLREPGFTAVFGNKGSRDDCGLAVRKSRFLLLEGGTHTLSQLTYQTESHGISDTTEGAYGVIKDKVTGEIGVVVVVHMPHGMQEDLRKGRAGSDVARAYRGILKGAKHLANGLSRVYHAAWTMIVGDWNLNIKSAWVRPFFVANFPSYSVNWDKPYPAGGTFQGLIIDLALLRGIKVVAGPRLLHPEDGFDHRGWTELLR